MAHSTPKSTTRPTPDFDPDESALHDLLASPQPLCPPVDILLAYTEGVLPAESQETVRLHLVTCRLCPLLLADLAALPESPLSATQMERIRATLPSHFGRTQADVRLYAFIGIAATLLLATFLFLSAHSRDALPPSVASVAAPAAPAATLEIPLSPLAPPQDMLTRGGESAEAPSVDKLMPAFTAYNRRDYATAVSHFTQLQSRYPHNETVLLYLGIAQLFLHQDAKAYATLTSIQHPHAASADALHWYTAVAAERTHVGDAPELFGHICANKASRWSEQSCNIQAQLR